MVINCFSTFRLRRGECCGRMIVSGPCRYIKFVWFVDSRWDILQLAMKCRFAERGLYTSVMNNLIKLTSCETWLYFPYAISVFQILSFPCKYNCQILRFCTEITYLTMFVVWQISSIIVRRHLLKRILRNLIFDLKSSPLLSQRASFNSELR